MMEAQFEAMEGRLEELTVATAQPEIIADVPKWQGMLKEMARLEPAVNAWRQYRQLLSEIRQAKEMRSDPDMGDMAEEELKELLPREEQEREKLRLFLIPHDPNDERSVVMEIRPGAGGRKRLCSPPCCCACTSVTPSAGAISSRRWIFRTRNWAASRKRCSP